jgi:hypothetical protein
MIATREQLPVPSRRSVESQVQEQARPASVQPQRVPAIELDLELELELELAQVPAEQRRA